MPDLNALLRWSIENSTAPAADDASDQQMSIRFNPASSLTGPTTTSATLHPSDPQYRAPNASGEDAPASAPLPAPPVEKRSDLTSEMLDHIMGKSDSTIMKEKMEFAVDESQSVEDRVSALDDFEMVCDLLLAFGHGTLMA
jgi:hsp70-interacting protein